MVGGEETDLVGEDGKGKSELVKQLKRLVDRCWLWDKILIGRQKKDSLLAGLVDQADCEPDWGPGLILLVTIKNISVHTAVGINDIYVD